MEENKNMEDKHWEAQMSAGTEPIVSGQEGGGKHERINKWSETEWSREDHE